MSRENFRRPFDPKIPPLAGAGARQPTFLAWGGLVRRRHQQPPPPIPPVVVALNLTDASQAALSMGTTQVLLGANANRQILWIENPLANTQPIYINFNQTAAANQTSYMIQPGGGFFQSSPGVSADAINVFMAGSGTYSVFCKWA